MMFDKLDEDVEDVVYDRFFDKIRKEREEWLQKDLVVDMRESYRNWMWRQLNFEEAPLVPREELPANLQPQNSFRAKIINYVNGIDPRLPSKANKYQVNQPQNDGIAGNKVQAVLPNRMDVGAQDIELAAAPRQINPQEVKQMLEQYDQ